MAHSGQCRQGGALHVVVCIRWARGGPTSALHCWGVQGQQGEAEVSEACLDLLDLEMKKSPEREGIQPGQGRAACTTAQEQRENTSYAKRSKTRENLQSQVRQSALLKFAKSMKTIQNHFEAWNICKDKQQAHAQLATPSKPAY